MHPDKAHYIERLTSWLMPKEADPDREAVLEHTTLDGLYRGKSTKIRRLIRIAYLRGVRRGASIAWDARQPICLRNGSMTATFLQECPRDGREYDTQCARCGSSLVFEACETCNGEGEVEYDCDPLEELDDGDSTCPDCEGERCFPVCLASEQWCMAHPLEGRALVERSTPEYFAIE